jgi:hypothetical protein
LQSPENGRLQKKSYDIDSKDFFWAKNGGNPFPQVAEDIDAELSRLAADLGDSNKQLTSDTSRTPLSSLAQQVSATSTMFRKCERKVPQRYSSRLMTATSLQILRISRPPLLLYPNSQPENILSTHT